VRAIRRTALIGVAAVAAATAMGTGTASAGTGPHTLYVGPHAGSSPARYGSSCQHPDASTIQAGVDAVTRGGTVVVCAGTYQESVSIHQKLTLQGRHGAVVDATGKPYGIGIGADHVTVSGLTVENAGVGVQPPPEGAPPSPNDGILTAAFTDRGPVAGNYARIIDVVATGNTGAGIDVNSTHGTLVEHSRSVRNGAVGINVADDLGLPSNDNKILDNVTTDNKTGCGVALADHTGAGINRNLVAGNTADRNGLGAGGAGLLIATPLNPSGPPAVIKDNVFLGNEAHGNAHAGFELHIHAPGNTISGNKVIANRFGTNNTLGDWEDTSTTGVFLGSNSPTSIELVGNTITGDVYGIYQAGPVDLHAHATTFHGVTTPLFSRTDYAG
jgi:Right handed beta helix region